MEEIISLIVANGVFAVLFCGLLAYELRDSRKREGNYTKTIRMLGERLGEVEAVKADTERILAELNDIAADTESVKRAVVRRDKKSGGGECAKATA